mmetsp:Transcript_16431/g.45331  ORF Transcript_16431/g.45331 Transcript_16431/m.45331 type:complete len:206 (+) Transcript_16431:792-1409(+)
MIVHQAIVIVVVVVGFIPVLLFVGSRCQQGQKGGRRQDAVGDEICGLGQRVQIKGIAHARRLGGSKDAGQVGPNYTDFLEEQPVFRRGIGDSPRIRNGNLQDELHPERRRFPVVIFEACSFPHFGIIVVVGSRFRLFHANVLGTIDQSVSALVVVSVPRTSDEDVDVSGSKHDVFPVVDPWMMSRVGQLPPKVLLDGRRPELVER